MDRNQKVRSGVLSLLILAAAIPGASYAQSDSDKKPKVFVKERTVDLGRVKEGDRVTARFTLENQGDADLQINRVHASCGCTVPRDLTADESKVEPGETLILEAAFDSTGRRGQQRKGVTVASNDSTEPELQLFLTAEVIGLFDVMVNDRPAKQLTFGSLHPGSEIKDPVDLIPTDPGKTLDVPSLEIRSASLLYTTEPLKKDDRTGVRVKLRIDPDAPLGQVVTSLMINGRVGEDSAESNLSISGEVAGALTYRPINIKQIEAMLPGTMLAPVTVSSESTEPFEILSVTAGSNLTAAVERQDSTNYSIRLTINESAPPGPFGTNLDILTDLVEQPLIRIPVFASVRPLVDVQPPRIALVTGGSARSRRVVKVESTSYTALEISDVTTDVPYVTAKVVPSPGRQSQAVKHVEIELKGTPPIAGASANVRIRTNVAAQPEVVVPVTLLSH